MAQEDKGLILRGFLLVALISCIVAFVLALLFWRNDPPVVALDKSPPEHVVPLAAIPTIAPFPSNVSWVALVEVSEHSPSAPGFDVRYNAAATMARRGEPATPWPILLEMLDEKQQMRNSRERQPDGAYRYDAMTARAKTLSALRAIADWHEKHKSDAKPDVPSDLRAVYARVNELATSGQGTVKEQAEKTRATFFR